MNDVGNIQWFPGHMTKTKRLIEADLKMVDAVVEITDARIPESSRNPILDDLVKDKPRIILMNKCDYADENATRLWKQYYEKRGIRVLTCDCRSGKGLNRFLPEVKTMLADLIERRKKRGQRRARADSGKRLLAVEVADDDGVGSVVELLQEVSCHDRQRKLHNELPRRAPGHILCHFRLPTTSDQLDLFYHSGK